MDYGALEAMVTAARRGARSAERAYPWPSETDRARCCLLFERIAEALATAPLRPERIEHHAQGRGPERAFAQINGEGAVLLVTSSWYGGLPGDALRRVFRLLLEDGTLIETSTVDLCTQSSIVFDLWGLSASRRDVVLTTLDRVVARHLEALVETVCEQAEHLLAHWPCNGR